MENRTYYTAVGNFRQKTDTEGNTYPVVYVNQQEKMLDLQEMSVWTILNWRLLDVRQLEDKYDLLARDLHLLENRTLENCLKRLEMRGLVAAGSGENDLEALYDLLGGLYVIPISESLILRTAAFLKMLLWDKVPFATAKQLFQKCRLGACEKQVLALSKQALLSTAELVKCVELGITDLSSGKRIMDALYCDEDTTSDNIRYLMLRSECRASVTLAVANLCLSKQIIFERV